MAGIPKAIRNKYFVGYDNFRHFRENLPECWDWQIIELCEISKKTYKRWINGTTCPPRSAVKLINMALSGVIPFDGWQNCHFNRFGLDLGGKRAIAIENLDTYYEHLNACDWQRSNQKMQADEIFRLRNKLSKKVLRTQRKIEILIDGQVVQSLAV